MDTGKELNLEALEKIYGGAELDEERKKELEMEIRVYKTCGITLDSLLKDMSRRSGNDEIREYIVSVWDKLDSLKTH